MTNSSVSYVFEFPMFRFVRLLYSIPIVGLIMWLHTEIVIKLELWLSGYATWIWFLIFTIDLVLLVAVTIKLFFVMNLRIVTVWADDLGFQMNTPRTKKILWYKIKTVSIVRDKYESRANEPGSTIILGFGFMKKIKVINCSTWTIFSKAKRKKYQHDFELFKDLIRRRAIHAKT